jgi:hypothetical protein
MATVRFYAVRGISDSIDNSVANIHAAQGAWNPSPGANPEIHRLHLDKSDQVVSGQQLQFLFPDGVAGHASMQFMFGYQLPSDCVINGDFDLGFYSWVNHGGADPTVFDGHWVVHAWVAAADTGTVRGTLVDNYSEASGVNTLPSLGSGIVATQLNAPVAITPVDALAGDYLIVECGFVLLGSNPDPPDEFRFGTRDNSGVVTDDIVAGDADADLHATWIEMDISDAGSYRNLLTGSTHTVQGSDNLIVGVGGTVTGQINALFALCDDSPAPEITGDRTFRVCADTIDLVADTVLINGVAPASATDHLIGITIDGAGSAITTGVKGFIMTQISGTITEATLLSTDAAATACDIVIDVWKDTYANYPPDNADSITASAPPTLSSANKSQDSTLTGWTTSVTAGDIFGFNVDSNTGCTRATLMLTVTP